MQAIISDDKQGKLKVPIYIYIIYILSICELWMLCFLPPTPALTDHGPLFYIVHECMGEVVQDSLEPHLWGYRPRITLEHLTRHIQQQKEDFPILIEFLEKVYTYCGSSSHHGL